MDSQYTYRPALAFCFMLLCASCLTVRPSAVKAGKSLYETFLSAKGSTMYFIKPLDFFQKPGPGSIEMDFTFNYTKMGLANDAAFMKFSVFDAAVIKHLDSMRIDNGSKSAVLKALTHMFSDRAHKSYVNRFEAETSLSLLKELFQASSWRITLYHEGKAEVYVAGGKTKKKLVKLQQYVFAVL